MSQYNAAPLSAADNAGRDAIDPELAPFLPMTDQSGGSNSPAHTRAGQSVGSEMALPPNVEFVTLHAKVEFAGPPDPSRGCPHPGPHPCGACHASFPTNHQLERHAAKNKHKAYLCTCGKGFTKSSALRRHIQESTQAREHRCPLCDHQCKRPGHVEQHLRLIHKTPKDEIKKLLSSRNPEPRQEPKQASAAPAGVQATGTTSVQANYAVPNPGGPWIGPPGFSAAAPVDHPGSRPGYSSAFFPVPPALGVGQVIETPAFAPQDFMMVPAPGLPAFPAYPAGAPAFQTGMGFFPDPVPNVSGYPAAPLDGTNDLFNIIPASVSVDQADVFGMPGLENGFMEEFHGFDFNNFGI